MGVPIVPAPAVPVVPVPIVPVPIVPVVVPVPMVSVVPIDPVVPVVEDVPVVEPVRPRRIDLLVRFDVVDILPPLVVLCGDIVWPDIEPEVWLVVDPEPVAVWAKPVAGSVSAAAAAIKVILRIVSLL